MSQIYKLLASLFGIIVILFASLIGNEIGKIVGKSASQPTTHQVEQQLTKTMEEVAKQVNTKTPLVIDDETRLDKASVGPGARINYLYTLINHSSRDIDGNQFSKDFLPKIKSDICRNDNMKKAIQYGGIYSYSYFGNDGKLIASFDVNHIACSYKKISPSQ